MEINLLVISEEIASGIYEFRKVFDFIKMKKPDFNYEFIIEKKITKELFNSANCILFFRSRSVLAYKLAKLAKIKGKTTYLFLDDDFLGLDDNYGINKAGIWRGRKIALKRMLSYIDALISPNDLLCDKYASIGEVNRKVRIDTPVEGETLVRNKIRDFSRIALYINDGSMDMFEKYLRPAIKKLGELKPNYFTLDLLSLHPECKDLSGVNVNYVPHMTYPSFRKYLDSSSISIGLAPLDDKGFNQYKYFNKYIEYTRSGILGIYSDCPLYRQVITNEQNGILVNNTAEEWANAVLFCIEHPDEYSRMLCTAQTAISSRFNIESISSRLIDSLPELFDKVESIMATDVDIDIIKVIHYFSRFRERGYLFFRYFKVGGIRTVINALKYRVERNKELSE